MRERYLLFHYLVTDEKIKFIKELRALCDQEFGKLPHLKDAKNFMDKVWNDHAAYPFTSTPNSVWVAIFKDYYWKNDSPFLNDPLPWAKPEEKPELEEVRLIGWRGFRYLHGKLEPLSSYRTHQFSVIGENADPNGPPGMEDHYGFWAFKTKSQILDYCGWVPQSPWFFPARSIAYNAIFATILMYGEIVEHDKGFRTEKFEILNLYSVRNNSTRRGMANKLGWPAKKIAHISEGKETFC